MSIFSKTSNNLSLYDDHININISQPPPINPGGDALFSIRYNFQNYRADCEESLTKVYLHT